MKTSTTELPPSHNGRWVNLTVIVGETRKFVSLRYSPRKVNHNGRTTTTSSEVPR